jgi:hypothetical protein
MKLRHILIAGTTLISAAAMAAGDQAKQPGARGTSQDTQTQSGSKAAKSQGMEQDRSAHGSQSQAGGSQGMAQSGQDSETVKKAQEALASQGYNPGPADGVWGPRTSDAVKKAQTAKSIEPTGQLDDRTLVALGVTGGSGAASSSERSTSGSGTTATTPERSATTAPERSTESKSETPATTPSAQQPSMGSGSADSGRPKQ